MIKKAILAIVVLGLLVGFGNIIIAGNGCGITKGASCGSKADNVQKADVEAKPTVGCSACEKAGEGKACDHCAAKGIENAKTDAHAGCDKSVKSTDACGSCKAHAGAKAVTCADCVKAGKMCVSCTAKAEGSKEKTPTNN